MTKVWEVVDKKFFWGLPVLTVGSSNYSTTTPPHQGLQGLRSAGDPLSGLVISGNIGFRGSDASCPHSVPRASSEPCNLRPQDHEGRFLPEPLQTNRKAMVVPSLLDYPQGATDSLLGCPGPPRPTPILDPSTNGHLPMGLAPASFSSP